MADSASIRDEEPVASQADRVSFWLMHLMIDSCSVMAQSMQLQSGLSAKHQVLGHCAHQSERLR
jgi:hypothetical protein